MELTIAGTVNANPTARDIAAALNAPSFPEDWSIALDDNMGNDVMIEAEYDPIGTFRVSCFEHRKFRHAVTNLDTATLGTMLQKFLVNDRSWRDLCQWESPEENKVRVEAAAIAERKAEMAAAAAAPRPPATPGSTILSFASLAILAFGGYCVFKLATQGLGFVTGSFPKAEAQLAVLTGGMGTFALLMFIAIYSRARQAQTWPKAAGRVIVSKVVTCTDDSGDGSTRRLYRPLIEFAYTVDGKDYRSRQYQLDADASGGETWAKSITAKYPVGGVVEVRYNPVSPRDAALKNQVAAKWLVFGLAVFLFAICLHALHVSG